MSRNGSYLVLFYITHPFLKIDGFSEKKARKYRMNRAFRAGQVTGFGRKTDGFWTGKGVDCLFSTIKNSLLLSNSVQEGLKLSLFYSYMVASQGSINFVFILLI